MQPTAHGHQYPCIAEGCTNRRRKGGLCGSCAKQRVGEFGTSLMMDEAALLQATRRRFGGVDARGSARTRRMCDECNRFARPRTTKCHQHSKKGSVGSNGRMTSSLLPATDTQSKKQGLGTRPAAVIVSDLSQAFFMQSMCNKPEAAPPTQPPPPQLQPKASATRGPQSRTVVNEDIRLRASRREREITEVMAPVRAADAARRAALQRERLFACPFFAEAIREVESDRAIA